MAHSIADAPASLPKKFINCPSTVVPDMLDGLCALNTHLARLHPLNVIVQRNCLNAPLPHVAVISGGGSGHEPMAGGFVGKGMLAAAVAGEVFASPNVDSVLAAIETTASKSHGALLIVLQYTGDRLCFGAAAAIARSRVLLCSLESLRCAVQEGIPVEMVLVGDDCALPLDDSHAGRRGLCGIAFVLKIAGALAESGASLSEVFSTASVAAKSVRTYGVAASACSVPGAKPAFTLGANEIELGLGIHGERGLERGLMPPVASLVGDIMLKPILSELKQLISNGSATSFALAVNGLGGTPLMELLIVAREALKQLEEKEDVQVPLVLCGQFVTSLEMAGFSLTLLLLTPMFKELLLSPCDGSCYSSGTSFDAKSASFVRAFAPITTAQPTSLEPALPNLRECIEAVCAVLQVNKDFLTALDQAVGDGDLGISLSTAATAVSAALTTLPLHSLHLTLKAISEIVRIAIGGTSGPLYTVALLGAAEALEASDAKPHMSKWEIGLRAAAEAISALGGAKVGDRTMLDALVPASETSATESDAQTARHAADAAQAGATKTANLLPRKGRSSYLRERALGCLDPGAVAIALQLDAIAKTLVK